MLLDIQHRNRSNIMPILILVMIFFGCLVGTLHYIVQCKERFNEPEQMELAFIRDERIRRRPMQVLSDLTMICVLGSICLGLGLLLGQFEPSVNRSASAFDYNQSAGKSKNVVRVCIVTYDGSYKCQ